MSTDEEIATATCNYIKKYYTPDLLTISILGPQNVSELSMTVENSLGKVVKDSVENYPSKDIMYENPFSDGMPEVDDNRIL